MKVVFLLDNSEYLAVDPTSLQLRQIAPGQSVLGLDVTVPVRNEDGTTKTKEDGTVETTTGFRPIINYAVNLYVPGATIEDDVKTLKTLLKLKKEELATQQETAVKEKVLAAKKSKAKRVN